MLPGVSRRRKALSVAIVILLAALAVATSVRPGGIANPAKPDPEEAGAPAAPTGGAGPRVERLSFDLREPRRRTVERGAHAIIVVLAPQPGEAAIPRLGLVDAGTPAAPASFDVLLDAPGHYPVTFTPVEGRSKPVGSIVVEPQRGASAETRSGADRRPGRRARR